MYHEVTYNELMACRLGDDAESVGRRDASMHCVAGSCTAAKRNTGRPEMPTLKRILLCYDGTREGQHALKDGAALAQDLNAEVHVPSVINNCSLDARSESLRLSPSI